MIHAHHDHSDIRSGTGTHTCAWVCTHRHQCAFKHNFCCATTRRNSDTAMHSRTVQNLQPLKIVQPCPRTRGYHRNLIAGQVSTTTTKNQPITYMLCISYTWMRHQHPHILYILEMMCNSTGDLQQLQQLISLHNVISGIPHSKYRVLLSF